MSARDVGKVYVAGHRGLVGSALVRALVALGIQPLARTRAELDLRDAPAVRKFFDAERPDVVFLAAAKVGGIAANAARGWEFLLENLEIQNAVLRAAMEYGSRRVIFFGSSCIYPKLAPQPIREEYLLTGPLEPTNEPYAIAKIAGLKLVEGAEREYGKRWVSLMPTNLYGPGDNFDLERSHVLPAMIRKFDDARRNGGPVTLWGSGTVRREFLYVDDLASAALRMMANDATGLFNVGAGDDLTIRELAEVVARVIGYSGEVVWDATRPDGTPRKLLDSSKIRATGWAPQVSIEDGIARTYEAFLAGEGRL